MIIVRAHTHTHKQTHTNIHVHARKVDSLADDYEGLRLHFERIKEHRVHETQTRSQLFGDMNTIRERRQNADYQQREGESLTHSINMLDQQLDTGMEVLNSLDRQGRVLQDSTGKLKDANSLVGLANSVVRMIGFSFFYS